YLAAAADAPIATHRDVERRGTASRYDPVWLDDEVAELVKSAAGEILRCGVVTQKVVEEAGAAIPVVGQELLETRFLDPDHVVNRLRPASLLVAASVLDRGSQLLVIRLLASGHDADEVVCRATHVPLEERAAARRIDVVARAGRI